MTVVHENVFIFFPFADIQMLHNFAARTMFNNDFTIWRSILIHYTTNKYLLVSTTPPTLSILQFNLPAAINRESSLEDTTLKCPVRIICTLISLNQVKKRLNFRMPNPVHSISCPVAWKFFRLSFRRWFIHLFVHSGISLKKLQADSSTLIIVNHLSCDIHDQSMSRLHQTTCLWTISSQNLHIFSQWWSNARH